jgi:hypothetical protein
LKYFDKIFSKNFSVLTCNNVSDPENTDLAKLNNEWLKEIMERFEEWPD